MRLHVMLMLSAINVQGPNRQLCQPQPRIARIPSPLSDRHVCALPLPSGVEADAEQVRPGPTLPEKRRHLCGTEGDGT